MIFLKITKEDGEILLDTFPVDFIVPNQQTNKNSKFRYFKEKLDSDSIEVYINEQKKIIGSNKTLNQFLFLLRTAIKKIVSSLEDKVSEKAERRASEMTTNYLHNIVKIHGNQKNIIERCVEGAEGHQSYQDYVDAVKQKIIKNPEDFANDICALSKEVRLIEYHTAGYNLLHEISSKVDITHNHKLKKILLGLAHLFFDDLSKNNITFNLYDVDEDFRCSFEYETFNIAIHCFLENIVKYTKPYTEVYVYTKPDEAKLIFEMESIRINKDEIPKIFQRGISGSHVPEFLRGDGIGMYLLKTALDRSDIKFRIDPDFSDNSTLENIEYTKNKFTFSFPS